jgi:hypothetical protein
MIDQKWEDEFQKSYKKYLAKDNSIINDRIRPDKQYFFDALMSVDMKNDPDGKKAIEIIKAL